jgi:ATP-binding cassette subfamily B protein
MPSPVSASEFVVANDFSYDTRSPLRWIGAHTLRYYPFIATFFIGAFCNGLGASIIPILIGIAFNTILSDHPDMTIVAWCAIGAIVSQILRAVLQYMRNASAELIGQRVERDARQELYANLLGKSMAFHSMQSVGDIMARATNDVHELYLMFSQGFNLILGSAFFLLFPLILSPSISPSLVIIPLLFTVAYFITVRTHLIKLKPATDAVRATFGAMNASLAEAIDGIETVKGASQEKNEIARFTHNATAFRAAYVAQGRLESRFIPLLVLGIAIGSAFLHSLLLLHAGQITIGNVVTYMGYVSLYGFPVGVSLYGYSQFSLGIAASRRILELLQTQTVLDQNSIGHAGTIHGDVTFDAVGFGYPEASASLQSLDFSVKSGQVVALVGQTGAGKSTLVKLINRTYDTTAGQVLIDGINVREWSLESLRSQIAIIEQDIFLFSRTIAENIAFGKPGATQAEIEQAARDAQAHEFITGFSEGYQTVIGMRGVTLSGGQRQRLALARAFLSDPRILILDDSTSAIDSATEDQIQKAIYRATQGRTTFIITHRLSQIRWADQIIVLRMGKIVAIGKHEELLQSSEAYRRIFPTEKTHQSDIAPQATTEINETVWPQPLPTGR